MCVCVYVCVWMGRGQRDWRYQAEVSPGTSAEGRGTQRAPPAAGLVLLGFVPAGKMRKGRGGTTSQLKHLVKLLVSCRLKQLAQLWAPGRKVLCVVYVEKGLLSAARLASLRVHLGVGRLRCVEDREHPLDPGSVEQLPHDHEAILAEVALDLHRRATHTPGSGHGSLGHAHCTSLTPARSHTL